MLFQMVADRLACTMKIVLYFSSNDFILKLSKFSTNAATYAELKREHMTVRNESESDIIRFETDEMSPQRAFVACV